MKPGDDLCVRSWFSRGRFTIIYQSRLSILFNTYFEMTARHGVDCPARFLISLLVILMWKQRFSDWIMNVMVLCGIQKKPLLLVSGTFGWKLGTIPFQVTASCEVDEQEKTKILHLKRITMACSECTSVWFLVGKLAKIGPRIFRNPLNSKLYSSIFSAYSILISTGE